MRFCFALMVCIWAATAQSEEHPKWESLSNLLKRAVDSPEVQKFVATHKLEEITKGPSGSYFPSDHAYSLLYRRSQISTIVVRVAPRPKEFSEPHWRAYTGKLPGGLSVDDGRADVIEKLGLPIKERKNTWLHGKLHIWVHFNQNGDRIDELFISPQVIEAKAQE